MTRRIIEWNEQRGFLKEFDMKRELSYTLSEELEMLQWKNLASLIAASNSDYEVELMHIVAYGKHDDFALWLVDKLLRPDVTKTDYIDKCLDQRVFNDGGMAKCLGADNITYTTGLIDTMLDEVMTANECKPIGRVTDGGKQEKGEGFEAIDPKHKIQRVLKTLGIEG